jgi:inorganic pyrophosphatase
MGNLAKLAHQLDVKQRTCRAVVETPKGSRAKFDYDSDMHAFYVKTLLPDGMSFPLDFGFIPSTLAGDGDPLDVMILVDQPCPTGSVLDVRLLGAIEAEEVENGRKERNDRILGAACISRLYAKVEKPGDVGDGFIDNLVEFWVNKAKLEGKVFRCLGVTASERAIDLIKGSAKAAKKH